MGGGPPWLGVQLKEANATHGSPPAAAALMNNRQLYHVALTFTLPETPVNEEVGIFQVRYGGTASYGTCCVHRVGRPDADRLLATC